MTDITQGKAPRRPLGERIERIEARLETPRTAARIRSRSARAFLVCMALAPMLLTIAAERRSLAFLLMGVFCFSGALINAALWSLTKGGRRS